MVIIPTTTVKIKKEVQLRLHKLKPHKKCTHSDTIEFLIEEYDKRKVKTDEQN